jgi:hypothetical protein
MTTKQHLQIDRTNKLRMSLQNLIGESIAVLGIKGSGKTNTAAVLIEELLDFGLPLTIVDIEGEYWGLKEKFEILVAGRSANVDLEISPSHAGKIAEFSVQNAISVILDLSEYSQEEMFDFLLRYFTALWETSFVVRRPYEIVLEEAHEFVPQTVRSPLKEVLTRIALRGRKRGLGIISVSQRSAKVEKDVLTQASILLLHRVVHPVDIRVYQDILPLPPKEVETLISALNPGEAIVLNNHHVEVIQVRLRRTFHVGATPQLDSVTTPRLRRVDKKLLNNLRQLLDSVHEYEDANEKLIKQLQETVVEKDAIIEELQKQVEQLKVQNEILGKIELSVISGLRDDVISPSPNRNLLQIDPIRSVTVVSEDAKFEFNKLESTSSILGQIPNVPELQRQQRRFSSLLQDMKKLPKTQRSIVRFLIEREGSSMNTKDLARWLELRESTVKRNLPIDLLKLGLLTRSGTKGHYRYSASHRILLGKEFPDIDPEILIQSLIVNC